MSDTETLLYNWLRGTTCDRPQRKRVVWENDSFILLKHNSHSEYINRFNGVDTCQSYVELYRKADLRKLHHGRPLDVHRIALGHWGGRWNKTNLADAMAIVGSS